MTNKAHFVHFKAYAEFSQDIICTTVYEKCISEYLDLKTNCNKNNFKANLSPKLNLAMKLLLQ